MSIVYLNGNFIPEKEATVSVLDRGFLFGDGVYEVIPVFDGILFGAEEHLSRLDASCQAISLTPPLSHSQWLSLLKQLLVHNEKQIGSCNFYLQITRGVDQVRQHAISPSSTPTVFAFVTSGKFKTIDELRIGFKAITAEDVRWKNCYIKATTLLPNVLAFTQAQKHNAVEAILIRDGYAIEGTMSNLFIVKNGVLQTPPLQREMLGGVTRQFILKLAKENNLPYIEEQIPEKLLFEADEIWVTGSSKEICPIVQLNETPIGHGKVGPIWEKMVQWYEQLKTSRNDK